MISSQTLCCVQSSPIRTILLRVALAAAPVVVLPDAILPAFMLPKLRVPAFPDIRSRVPKCVASSDSSIRPSSWLHSSHPFRVVWFPSAEERTLRPEDQVLHPLVVQLDRSIGLMEQQLARLGLRQEWLPYNSSFFYALGQQMVRKRLLAPSTVMTEFVAQQTETAAAFLKQHESALKVEGIFPNGELQGQMLASACLHNCTIVHWSAASEGLVETIYSPPQDVRSRCRVYVCSVGPVLWSTMPFGPGEVKISFGGIDGLVSESRISDEIAQRLLRAQALTTAVRWVSTHRAVHTPSLELRSQQMHERNGRVEKATKSNDIKRDKKEEAVTYVGQGPPILVSAGAEKVAQARSRTRPSKQTVKDIPNMDPRDPSGHSGKGDATRTTQSPSTYCLIDMSGLIFRSFHAIPNMTRDDGVANNAVFGVCRMIQKIVQSVPEGSVIVPVFDKGSHTFRKDLYPEYKAHRPPVNERLVPQFDLIREATAAFGLQVVDKEGFEADDIIASYAVLAAATGATVRIVSSDKDLCQLVNDRVTLWDPKDNKEIGVAEVVGKFGVPPSQVADVQALIGDASDNVPGVRGIGPKTAKELINQFGDLETLLQCEEQVKPPRARQALKDNKHLALLSYQLVLLRTDLDLPPLSTFLYRGANKPALRALYQHHGFKSLIADLDRPPASAPRSRTRKTAAAAAAEAILDAAASAAIAGATSVESGGGSRMEVVGEGAYTVVVREEELVAWARAAEREGRLALVPVGSSSHAQTADLVGLALAVVPGAACYVPLRPSPYPEEGAGESEEGAGGSEMVSMEEVVRVLGGVLGSRSVVKVGHDIKFLVSMLARYAPGVELRGADDTMLLSFVVDAGKHPHAHADLALSELGVTALTLKDLAQRAANKPLRGQPLLAAMPPQVVCDFPAQAADLSLRLHSRLADRVVRERLSRVYYHMERPLVGVLARMEQLGVQVDTAKLTLLSADFAGRIAGLEKDIYTAAGREFSIGSPKQLAQVLFEELKLPMTGKKGKSGAVSTDSEVLDQLAGQGHAIADKINEWRQVSKLKSTFTDGLLAQINPRTGRVHTCFCMAAAATGRLSSIDPNLQNIPTVGLGKPIREAFTAAAGYTLLSADYSQIELRLLAHMARIEALQEAFHKGIDVHSLTASQVFGVPLDKMTPDVRRKAKAINFGIIYGQSAFGLAKGLGISVADAKKYIETYFERYPGIQTYMTSTREAATRQGYVETLFGRRCHIVNMAKSGALRSYAERQAINAPIQGTAADIIKRAMVRMEPALAAAGLGARMVLQVHDELVFEVPEGQEEATAQVVKEVMQTAAEPTHTLSVPLIVDSGTGVSWGAAH